MEVMNVKTDLIVSELTKDRAENAQKLAEIAEQIKHLGEKDDKLMEQVLEAVEKGEKLSTRVTKDIQTFKQQQQADKLAQK